MKKSDVENSLLQKTKKRWQLIGSISIIIGIVFIAGLFGAIKFGWFKKPITMTLNGEQNIVINFNGTYIDEGVTAVLGDEDISSNVQVVSNLDTSKLGQYTITYQYENTQLSRSIEVADTEPPKINMMGDVSMVLTIGECFEDPSCTVTDNCDSEIADRLEVIGVVDTAAIGTYTLVYKVTDNSGNIATAERQVEVIRNSPLTQDIETFNLDGLFTHAILKETEMQSDDYILNTAFIGDSVNSIFLYSGAVPAEQVWHVVSITPKKALKWEVLNNGTKRRMLIMDMIETYQPERIILTMGVNCVGFIAPEEIAKDYLKLVQEIREQTPEVEIVIQNILPVKSYYDSPDRAWSEPSNDKINKANYYIAQMCEQNNIYFLDSAHVLKDETGAAKRELYDDGFHPSREGMRLVTDYILCHALLN